MDSRYSGSLVGDDYSENSMETHAEDDSSIATEERDENSSEEEQSSITTENSSEEEIDPWSTLINDAVFLFSFTCLFNHIKHNVITITLSP